MICLCELHEPAKTTVHIHRLFEKFGFDKVFGNSAVMEVLELKDSGLQNFFQIWYRQILLKRYLVMDCIAQEMSNSLKELRFYRFKGVKILSLRMTKEPCFTLTEQGTYVTRAYIEKVISIGMFLGKKYKKISYNKKYLLKT